MAGESHHMPVYSLPFTCTQCTTHRGWVDWGDRLCIDQTLQVTKTLHGFLVVDSFNTVTNVVNV